MWDEVKPITLVLEQKNDDGSKFVLHFYSSDSELVKLKEAFHFNECGKPIGSYLRLQHPTDKCEYNSNFFVGKLTKITIKKLIEYFENPNLFIEFMI